MPGTNLTPKQIAGAFSSHKFESAFPYLAQDIKWNVVGGEQLDGKDGVVKACDDLANHLKDVATSFGNFRTIVGENSVVIDSLAGYTDKDKDVSVVASCDIYTFADGKVTEVTSYNIEIGSR